MRKIKKPVKRVRKPIETTTKSTTNEIGEPIIDESSDKPSK